MKYELRYGQSWPYFFLCRPMNLRWKEMKRQTRRSRERRKVKNAKTDKISLQFACVVLHDSKKKLKSQFIRCQNEVSIMFLQTQHNEIQRRFFSVIFRVSKGRRRKSRKTGILRLSYFRLYLSLPKLRAQIKRRVDSHSTWLGGLLADSCRLEFQLWWVPTLVADQQRTSQFGNLLKEEETRHWSKR